MQAPRGEIRDRDGNLLVTNRTALALQVRAEELPESAKRRGKVLREVGGGRRSPHDQGPQGDPPADAGAALEPGDPEARRPDRARLLPAREPGPLPGGDRRAHLRAEVPAGTSRGSHLRLRTGDQRRAARGPATRTSSRATRSARTASSSPTTTFFAASTAPPGCRSTRRACRPAVRQRPGARARQRPRPLARLRAPGGGRVSAGLVRPARAFVAMDANNGEILAMGSNPDV